MKRPEDRDCIEDTRRSISLALPLSVALLLAVPLRTMVVPFDNLSPEGTHGWVGDAISESLLSHLRLVGHDVVSSEDRQELLRQKGIENGAPLTLAVLMEIGQE